MYEVFEQLCQKKGVTSYKVSKETSISQTTLSRWKTSGKDPNKNVLVKLADYFGVTVDYIINGDTTAGHYLSEEALKEAQEMYSDSDMRFLYDAKKKMSPQGFRAMRKSIEAYMEAEQGTSDEGC